MYHGIMTDLISKAALDALAEFRHHQALSIQHAKKADVSLHKFLDAIPLKDAPRATTQGPRCLAVWTRWLAENGPNTRSVIAEATGVKFTERATPHTYRWVDVLNADDDQISPLSIIRFVGKKTHDGQRGAPPVIYALWSQRYDVRTKFGVGPERPQAMTGVIQPPVSAHPIDPEFGEEQPLDFAAEPTVDDILQPQEIIYSDRAAEDFDHVAWAQRIIAERDGTPAPS